MLPPERRATWVVSADPEITAAAAGIPQGRVAADVTAALVDDLVIADHDRPPPGGASPAILSRAQILCHRGDPDALIALWTKYPGAILVGKRGRETAGDLARAAAARRGGYGIAGLLPEGAPVRVETVETDEEAESAVATVLALAKANGGYPDFAESIATAAMEGLLSNARRASAPPKGRAGAQPPVLQEGGAGAQPPQSSAGSRAISPDGGAGAQPPQSSAGSRAISPDGGAGAQPPQSSAGSPPARPGGGAGAQPPQSSVGPAPIILRCGAGAALIAVSVTDTAGSLTRATALENLVRCAAKGEAQIKDTAGSAGLGLYMVLQSSSWLEFHVIPGRQTTVTFATRIHPTLKAFDAEPRSLAFFQETPS